MKTVIILSPKNSVLYWRTFTARKMFDSEIHCKINIVSQKN